MAKKTETKAKPEASAKDAGKAAAKDTGKAAPKKPAKAAPKQAVRKIGPPVPAPRRDPRARLLAAHGSKEALAKSIAPALARADEDTDAIAARLRTASNQQLLRLAAATEKVKQKWGTREKLIAAIGAPQKKSTDTDYLAKLDTYSLSQLLELAPA
jgi:hypothetical protein